MPRARRWRNTRTAAALAAACLLGAGCAKDATSVTVTVDADSTVPPILILRTAVARAADPTRPVTANRSSPYEGDAAGRPGPFVFPLLLPVTIDARYAGPVVVTVEGIDWDTGTTIARGEATTAVVAQKDVQTSLTLTAAPPGGGDGGLD
jgi:hypothetical protein